MTASSRTADALASCLVCELFVVARENKITKCTTFEFQSIGKDRVIDSKGRGSVHNESLSISRGT
jgi:hypothetical protein